MSEAVRKAGGLEPLERRVLLSFSEPGLFGAPAALEAPGGLPGDEYTVAVEAEAAAEPDAPGDLPPVIGQNFEAISRGSAGTFPPDTMGAVGPLHVAELINEGYAVYDKDTGSISRSDLPINLQSFWEDEVGLGSGSTTFTFDPRIQFDPISERFFAVSLDGNNTDNELLVAASMTSDPLDGWYGWRYDTDGDNGERWADFPQLGYNADTIVVSMIMFPFGSFSGNTQQSVLVLEKADLVAGVPSPSNLFFEDVRSKGGVHTQPVIYPEGQGMPVQIVGHESAHTFLDNDELELTEITEFSGDAQLNNISDVNLGGTWDEPPAAAQPGSPGVPALDSGDLRVPSAVTFQNNLFWGVHGVGTDGGTAGIQWFKFDTDRDLVQSGVLSDSSMDYIYPSIAVNDWGDVVIGYTGVGSSNFASAYAVTGTTDAGGTTTFRQPVLLQAGTSDYQNIDTQGRNRWGDYSATVVDPSKPWVFWTFQEWAKGTNNWATQITEIAPVTPDLYGYGFDVTPEPLDAGQAFDVDYQLRNGAARPSTHTEVGFYLSTNSFISEGDLLLSTDTVPPIAALDFSDPRTEFLSLPDEDHDFWQGLSDGTYYVGMIIDPDEENLEATRSNNRNRGASLDYDGVVVDVNPPEDLRGETFTITQSAAEPGDTIDVDLRVLNAGNGQAGAFTVGVYLSPNSFISTGDTQLRQIAFAEGLPGLTATDVPTTVTLPKNDSAFWSALADGTYYLGAVYDIYDERAETDESNNANLGNGIDRDTFFVNVSPDLQGSQFLVQQSSLSAGESIDVDYRVANFGAQSSGAFDVDFFLSPDPTIEFGDYRIDGESHPGISANTLGSLRSRTWTLPGPENAIWDSGDGTYYVGMYVDILDDVYEDGTEDNNAGQGQGVDYDAISVDTARPDLRSTSFEIVPDPLGAGASFEYDFTVENTGSVASPEMDINLYVSRNDAMGHLFDELLGDTPVGPLDPGETQTLTGTLSLPGAGDSFWQGDGSYWIGLIIDPVDLVVEKDEGNNANRGEGIDLQEVFVDATPAELLGTHFDVTQAAISAGESADVDYEITNNGAGAAGAFTADVYLSGSSAISEADLQIGTIHVPGGLAAGAAASGTAAFAVPAQTDAFWSGDSTYFIGMIVDPDGQVIESDEGNNSNRGAGLDRDSLTINDRFGVISGTVFEDFDFDAARDAGEPGLADWLVFEDANANGRHDVNSTPQPGLAAPVGALVDEDDDIVTARALGAAPDTQDVRVAQNLLSGSNVYGYLSASNLQITWELGVAVLEFEFAVPMTEVRLQYQAPFVVDPFGTAEFFGRLEAYDESGSMVDFDETASLGSLGVDVMEVSTASAEIARVEAYGLPNDGGTLEDLIFSNQPGGVTGTFEREMYTHSDSAGDYSFDTLGAGQYVIREDLPAGWMAVAPPDAQHARTVDAATPVHADSDFANTQESTAVLGRRLFYNDSPWDNNDPAANGQDDNAIATGKHPLLPGHSVSPANRTGSSVGTNGVMVDIAGLSGAPDAGDFVFRAGTSGDPTGWALAPQPASITTRPGDGAAGSDRVTLIWADNDQDSTTDPNEAVSGQWLRVRMLSDANGGSLGLAADDVFYFGNLPGDANGDGSVTDADYTLWADHYSQTGPDAPPPGDFNLDGTVTDGDYTVWADHYNQSLEAPSAVVSAQAGLTPAAHQESAAAIDTDAAAQSSRAGFRAETRKPAPPRSSGRALGRAATQGPFRPSRGRRETIPGRLDARWNRVDLLTSPGEYSLRDDAIGAEEPEAEETDLLAILSAPESV